MKAGSDIAALAITSGMGTRDADSDLQNSVHGQGRLSVATTPPVNGAGLAVLNSTLTISNPIRNSRNYDGKSQTGSLSVIDVTGLNILRMMQTG
jgi:hypothetical protein